MPLSILDTMSREVREATPMDGETFRFYCCGPTVYGPAHIGNFRTFVFHDTFRRVLELSGTKTCHVRNITDVDDKTIRQSQAEGKSLTDFTTHWTEKFHRDCRALNLLPPHVEPSAVAHIAEQIEMIRTLMEKGHAYKTPDGSVYFNIRSFPQYGRLSRIETRDLQLGAAVDSDEYEKEGVSDFALWKARKPEDGPNFWPSPWGEGRPGWHLECSAMTRKYLGDSFDLHSGGVDLVFPHHENEIAQSECCTGHEFSRLWFHVNHLLVEGQKMSKKLGNLFTLDDLVARGYTPMQIRYVLLSGHYRTPANFALASLDGAASALARIAKTERALAQQAGATTLPPYQELVAHADAGLFGWAFDALLDDLNTPEALGRIFGTINRLQTPTMSAEEATKSWHGLHRVLAALGLDPLALASAVIQSDVPEDVRALAQERWEAKQAKNWAVADSLRKQLDAMGWAIKDGQNGYEIAQK